MTGTVGLAGASPAIAGAAAVALVMLAGASLVGSPRARRPADDPGSPGGPRRLGRLRVQQRWRRWWWSIPSVLVAAVTGLWLPMAAAATGWVIWRRWHLRHTEARQASRARRALPELIELLAIAVSAGQTPTQAIDELSTTAPPLLQPALVSVNHRLHHGHRFVDAIQVLREQFGLDAAGMVDLMVAADRDGLPAEPVLTQLAADARQQRRRDAEADARRLPVRLAAPLVLCTLPGFVLLAVVPLVAGALSSLSLP